MQSMSTDILFSLSLHHWLKHQPTNIVCEAFPLNIILLNNEVENNECTFDTIFLF